MAAAGKEPRTSSFYVGEVKKQLRDGYGLYIYPNSFFWYEGEWKQGKKHGHGKLLFKDGSYYEGEFTNGEIFGNGLRYWAGSGNTYSGQFCCGELHGYGVMQYKDGGRYEGAFSCGLREGHGLLVDKEGQYYQGSFYQNKKHGEGKMNFKNGDQYEGDWVMDQRQGHGVLHCLDGSVYEGQWSGDVFSGQGTIIHCSGVVYDGLWINGCPAAQAKKIVISGEDVIDVVQDSSFTLQVKLQTQEGVVAECENGRVLKIWAGIKNVPANSSPTFLELLEDLDEKPVKTPFGFECIGYPLVDASGKEEQNTEVPRISKYDFGLASSSVTKGDKELESGLDSLQGSGDAPSNLDGYPQFLVVEDTSPSGPANQRVKQGCALFPDISLAPLPAKYRHIMSMHEPDRKGGKKPSGRISAERAEKMTVWQEKIGDSRSESIAKEAKSKKELFPVDNAVRTACSFFNTAGRAFHIHGAKKRTKPFSWKSAADIPE
ncbi:MORN repeat-containing protein 1 isoform X2 [Rhinatrema bivittatum]|uniref:MORN repeat-containing protein 1 isoform X2 n=1 Tax=Rhinatrema bivittatum TaxID=194408 RepID=UPI00112B08BE|nr:MORN repeat-containing protein 1 isoform X2 [Rhinatrema bivittatum]